MPSESNRDPAFSAYREAQRLARALALGLGEESIRKIEEEIRKFARQLQRDVRELVDTSEFLERRISVGIADRAVARLERRLDEIVADRRNLAFDELRGVWSEASEKVAKDLGLPSGALASVRSPSISMAGAYEALGDASTTWKTLLHEYVARTGADVDGIVRQALTQGIGPDKLARRLHPYVVGSEDIRKAFRGTDLNFRALNGRDPRIRNAARKMRHNANRIAFSEVHNARAEAEVQTFAGDPMVRAVAWRLSPDRGTLVGADECDALAASDFYGLGEGIYPVNEAPVSPHPWDRCERVPATRTLDQAFDRQGNPRPKPLPPRNPGARPNFGRRVSSGRAARIEDRLEGVFATTAEVTPDVRPLIPG